MHVFKWGLGLTDMVLHVGTCLLLALGQTRLYISLGNI